MKKISLIIFIGSISLALSTLYYSRGLIKENKRLLANQEILIAKNTDITNTYQAYKVSDSLKALKVQELQLTLNEYKKYRTSDLQLIKQLRVKNSNLQKVITAQTETINDISAELNSHVQADTTNRLDTIKYFSYKSKWVDVSGQFYITGDSIALRVKNRESLKVFETIIYKRFLGFLWRTSKVKRRELDIVSENPNTSIVNTEYIGITR